MGIVYHKKANQIIANFLCSDHKIDSDYQDFMHYVYCISYTLKWMFFQQGPTAQRTIFNIL